MTTKAAALRAHKKTQRDLRAFLDALPGQKYTDPGRPFTASEEAKRQRLIQAERRAMEACWHADDAPPVPRKVSELRAELEADTRKHEGDLRKPEPEAQPAVPFNRRRCAYHEAAHAVAFEARGVRVLWVTLQKCKPEKPEAVGALCGAIAAQRIGFDDAQSPSDMAMAKAALLTEGKSEHRMPEVESQAQALVAARWSVIQTVAEALDESDELTGNQVRAVMGLTAFQIQERRRYNLLRPYAPHTLLEVA
jgi:hypothetical protein